MGLPHGGRLLANKSTRSGHGHLWAPLRGTYPEPRDKSTPPPWIPKPEPRLEDIPEEAWIYHEAQDKYHVAGPKDGRARCGWAYSRAVFHSGVAPPPWYWVLCSGCSPGLRAKVKEEAEATAAGVKRNST